MQRDEMHLLIDMFIHFQMEHLYKLEKTDHTVQDSDLNGENEMDL
jgi:hypothetical protein